MGRFFVLYPCKNVIFQIIITALELVMPDLLGALGIVLFLYPIGWYRIIIRLLVRIGSGGVLSYFLASLCPYLFIFFGKKLQIELQNCTAGIPAPTGFSRRTVLYLWYKKKGGTSMKRNIKKTAVAFFAAADRKGNIAAAITDRKKPAENMDAVFK